MENEGRLFAAAAYVLGETIVSSELDITRRNGGTLAYVATRAGSLQIQTSLGGAWETIETLPVVAGQADAWELPPGLWALRLRYVEGGAGAGTIEARVRF